jgi:hypothetical protein
MLRSHLFDADLWINEAEFAGNLLVMLAHDRRTRPQVIKALRETEKVGGGDVGFKVRPDWVLSEIGV